MKMTGLQGRLLGMLLCALATVTAQADTVTRTTAYIYTQVGKVEKAIVEPDSPQYRIETVNAYDGFGNLVRTTVSSPATGIAAIPSRTTSVTYDSAYNFPIATTNALNQSETSSFDARFGTLTSQSNNGLVVSWQYDSFGRKTLEIRPDGNRTKYEYLYCSGIANGAAGCPTGAMYVEVDTPLASDGVTQNGVWQKRYFDANGSVLRTEMQGFDGVSVTRSDIEYDSLGRVSRSSRPYYNNQTPQWTVNTYDQLGRIVLVTAPDSSQIRTEYNGLTTTSYNALGQRQTVLRNSAGEVTRVTDVQNNELSYEYDVQGNLIKTTDPKQNVITMTYDLLGRKLSMVDPDLGSITYAYDALGQLRRQTDAKGNVSTLTYDLLGRLTSRTEADLASTWTYDSCSMGRLCVSAADNGYSNAVSFDSLGRAYRSDITIDTTYTATNQYDSNGRLSVYTYPTGLAVKYVYTNLGYLKEVRNNDTNVLYWKADARDAEGRLTQQTYGNNVVTQQVFDPATGRVKNIYAGAGNAVQNLSFSYDVRGNMLTRADANQNLSESFLYDTLNRLTSNTVNSSGAGMVTQTYGYDSIGNVTSRSDMGTYTYSANGGVRPHAVSQIALAGGGTRQYSYDASGSLVQEVQRDAANNVIAAKGRTETQTSFGMPVTLASPAATLSFVYGPEHQRIKQIAPSATTVYLHPNNNGGLLYEKDIKTDGSAEHKHYITAGGGVVVLLKQTSAGTTALYFHRDHLGSTTAMTNAAGTVVERMAYEPFGKRRAPAGSLDPNNGLVGVATDRGYTNHEHLDELGLIHMNGRVYEPSIGRFISADPNVPFPTNIQSYNRYSYTRNNPLIMRDPSGFTEWACSEVWDEAKMQFIDNCIPGELDPAAVVDVPGQRSKPWDPVNAVVVGATDYLYFSGGIGSGISSVTVEINGKKCTNTNEICDGVAKGIPIEPIYPELDLIGDGVPRLAAILGRRGITTVGKIAIRPRIGANGKIGEDALKELGGTSKKFFRTSQGARFVDQFVSGVAHEAKTGYTTLTADIRRQILKDAELVKGTDVEKAVWHFFESPDTGIGASQPLLDFLKENGIDAVFHTTITKATP